MGVRFECPQGHKLHVKAHLSGQRGICPECGLRFIVPAFSGGRVTEAGADSSSTSSGFVSVAVESSASFNAGLNAATGADLDDGDESIVWHVRPVTGGQFGPVDAATFAQWISEGRVTADGWVWRTGWKDWKPGSEALKQFVPAGPLGFQTGSASTPSPTGQPRRPSTPSPAPRAGNPRGTIRSSAAPSTPAATSFDADLGDLLAAPRNGHPVAPTESPIVNARAEQMRRRKQLNQWLTIGLAVLAFVLLIVAVLVLRRSPPAADDGSAPPDAGTPFKDAPANP
jgi:hypothetical protein